MIFNFGDALPYYQSACLLTWAQNHPVPALHPVLDEQTRISCRLAGGLLNDWLYVVHKPQVRESVCVCGQQRGKEVPGRPQGYHLGITTHGSCSGGTGENRSVRGRTRLPCCVAVSEGRGAPFSERFPHRSVHFTSSGFTPRVDAGVKM